LPLLEWMTVRLDVSEDEWRRHNQDMEPQRRGSVPPLHSRKRNRTSGLSKTTLEVGVHLQPVGLNAETKKDRHRADGKRCLLTFPYIGLVRFARYTSKCLQFSRLMRLLVYQGYCGDDSVGHSCSGRTVELAPLGTAFSQSAHIVRNGLVYGKDCVPGYS
jgi:hypothetical protein